MEIIQGKRRLFIGDSAFLDRLQAYEALRLDIGTGDGRYVQHLAQRYPRQLAIGIDACRENLRVASRCAPTNALFIIANAEAMPQTLSGCAHTISINFPWGSLLRGLLNGDSPLLANLERVAHLGAEWQVRLNGGALAEIGWSLTEGARQARAVLGAGGFITEAEAPLSSADLTRLPTTWAKRLAHGRDPRAIYLRGTKRF